WPVRARLAAGTFYSMPGMPGPVPAVFPGVFAAEQHAGVPVARLAALVAVVALCLTGAWPPRPSGGPLATGGRPGRPAPADVVSRGAGGVEDRGMHLPVNPPVSPMLAKPVKQLPDGPYSYAPQCDGFQIRQARL